MANTILRRDLLLYASAFCIAAAGPALARAPEIFMDEGGFFGEAWRYAVGGYDVVAYYSLPAGADPVVGHDAFVTQYKGVSWRFASQENLETFAGDPAQFAPQYGGYCAWAMAREKLAKGDPEIWHVYGGKLYLNVSAGIQRKWLKNIDADIAAANVNWPGILDQ